MHLLWSANRFFRMSGGLAALKGQRVRTLEGDGVGIEDGGGAPVDTVGIRGDRPFERRFGRGDLA